MSGPFAEDAQWYSRTNATVALWPLRVWADNGVATDECAKCDYGELLVAGRPDRPFHLADLTARVEQHIEVCHGGRLPAGPRS